MRQDRLWVSGRRRGRSTLCSLLLVTNIRALDKLLPPFSSRQKKQNDIVNALSR